MKISYLIAGLGNPGKKYHETRHNIGFMVVDFLADKFNKKFKKNVDPFRSAVFKYNSEEIILLKPKTYMNLSGIAVALGVRYYDIVLSNLLVICDDIDLKFGTIRIRAKGSDGGQKGLRSIISNLETKDFARLRIGVGDHFQDAADYVLSPFSPEEKKDLPSIIQIAADATLSYILNGIELTMSRFNRTYFEN
jgi:PTH1 family peptidyl-tRNA hydrolase